ncbi:proline-rich protein HaeIII subfamily 1-like [Gouania willdenowi]|uniref:proline-rich protein HaeIII subfamily 1-like n=1 Tax=Gouania willdenowi TaxID=441366 RepID=UPI0010565639|nr:proline-rich protein HaeIII subfamily 1-like [Gouania willdenowi]
MPATRSTAGSFTPQAQSSASHIPQRSRGQPPPPAGPKRPSSREASACTRASTGPHGTTIQHPPQGGGLGRAPPQGGHPLSPTCRHETPPDASTAQRTVGPKPPAPPRPRQRGQSPGRWQESAPRDAQPKDPPPGHPHPDTAPTGRPQPADQPPPTQIRQARSHRPQGHEPHHPRPIDGPTPKPPGAAPPATPGKGHSPPPSSRADRSPQMPNPMG